MDHFLCAYVTTLRWKNDIYKTGCSLDIFILSAAAAGLFVDPKKVLYY